MSVFDLAAYQTVPVGVVNLGASAPMPLPLVTGSPVALVQTYVPSYLKGDPGSSSGFIRYDSGVVAKALAAGVQTQLTFTSASTADFLKGIFAGRALWDGAFLRGVVVGSAFTVKMTFSVVPAIIAGSLNIRISPSTTPPFPNETVVQMLVASGQTQVMTIEFTIGVQQGFLDLGGMILLTASVPMTVTRIYLSVYPVSA